MRETRSGSTTTPPMEFGPLRRHQFRWSLCRFTSPTPSALRVSHSLDGLFPPGPCGFVSRHIRPWDSDLQSFSLSTSRIASRRPLLSCRQISANSCELPPRLSSASVDSKRHREESSEIARAAPGECQQHHPRRLGSKPPKRYDERSQQPLERDA